jgi:hydrogenase maturation protease
MPPHPNLLVIGFGNTLRRDDGVGVKVAETVADLGLPGVTVIVRHQLVPELAEPISQARSVLFVDAAANTFAPLELRVVEPAAAAQILAHAADPGTLLALAREIFNRHPPAWTLAIPGEDFGFGDGLSPRAQAGFHAALAQIKTLAAMEHGRA